jgi:hypothetical protein
MHTYIYRQRLRRDKPTSVTSEHLASDSLKGKKRKELAERQKKMKGKKKKAPGSVPASIL